MKFSERTIAASLARYTFNRKCLIVVPNCLWTGFECDLFAVTNNLRIIDIEIKISRADLKADADKLDAEDAIDIARLAGLRLWDAYQSIDRLANDYRELNSMYSKLEKV